MKKILHITSSLGGGASFSSKLSGAIVEKLLAAYPDSTVKSIDVDKDRYAHIGAAQVASFHTPAEQRTPELIEAVRSSDEAIDELLNADIIVIGTPMYNFSVPSTLKAWIDHVVRAGKTFRYTETGVEGLVKGKKLYVAIASGSVYTEGVYRSYDFVEPYLKAVFGFIGITDVTISRAEGTAIPGMKESALQKAIDSILV